MSQPLAVAFLALPFTCCIVGAIAIILDLLHLWQPLIIVENKPILHRGFSIEQTSLWPAWSLFAILWVALLVIFNLATFREDHFWTNAIRMSLYLLSATLALALGSLIFGRGQTQWSGWHTALVTASFSAFWCIGAIVFLALAAPAWIQQLDYDMKRSRQLYCQRCGYDLCGSIPRGASKCPDFGNTIPTLQQDLIMDWLQSGRQ